jgi:SAM-dependent methyltransferase
MPHINDDQSNDTVPTPAYVLGHSDRELERLSAQARLVEPITRQFFQEAGIVSGMRVLDAGSGVGDVAFLAAELVGESGEVVGVDRSPLALAAARARANARSLANVSFIEGDFREVTFERSFDAVVGRYIMAHSPDPIAVLRSLTGHLHAGGVIVLHEVDYQGARSWPPVPTYDRCCQWIVETQRLLNSDLHVGIKLHSIFVAAGLPAPSMRLQAPIGGGAENMARLQSEIADLVETLLPAVERLGVATAADVNMETLATRLQNEVVANDSVIVGRSEIGAWSRVGRLG